MPTKQELYQIIQNYRALNCPKLNINSSKKDLQIAVMRIQNNMKFTSNTKTEAKTEAKRKTKPKALPTKTKDEIKKEIKSLFQEFKKNSAKIDKTENVNEGILLKNKNKDIINKIKTLKIQLK